MKEIKSPIDPVDIYNRFLAIKQEETQNIRNRENRHKYSASGAGMCKHKHWFDYNGYIKGESKIQDIRKMRLGTILGEDFDKAMAWFEKESLEAQIPDNNVKVYSETAVSHNILKINGHFDLLIVVEDTSSLKPWRKGYLYDYKSCHSYKYSQIGKNDSDNYSYQLATYAFMLEDSAELCDEVVSMELLYYNKNDSGIKSQKVLNPYKKLARDYWADVNYNQIRKTEPTQFGLEMLRTPYKAWECNGYCSFIDFCNSPHKKEK